MNLNIFDVGGATCVLLIGVLLQVNHVTIMYAFVFTGVEFSICKCRKVFMFNVYASDNPLFMCTRDAVSAALWLKDLDRICFECAGLVLLIVIGVSIYFYL